MTQQQGQILGDGILSDMAKTFQFAMEYGDDDTKNDTTYKNLAKKLCSIEYSYFLERDRIKEAAKQPTVDGFDEALTDNDADSAPFNASNSKRYKDFTKKMAKIANAHDGETSTQDIDDDLSRMADRINDIDPITKQSLKNPVRNRQCGHIYGKDSIMQSIQMNSRLRCPVVGCGNRNFIQLNDLVEDDELAERLDQQRQNDAK